VSRPQFAGNRGIAAGVTLSAAGFIVAPHFTACLGDYRRSLRKPFFPWVPFFPASNTASGGRVLVFRQSTDPIRDVSGEGVRGLGWEKKSCWDHMFLTQICATKKSTKFSVVHRSFDAVDHRMPLLVSNEGLYEGLQSGLW
jgi:hypothetical protein